MKHKFIVSDINQEVNILYDCKTRLLEELTHFHHMFLRAQNRLMIL